MAVHAALREAGVAVDVRTGGEIALDWLDRLSPADLGASGSAATRLPARRVPVLRLAARPARPPVPLRAAGFTPLIAHPERNTDVQAARNGSGLSSTRARSCRSRPRRSTADRPLVEAVRLELLELGLAHLLASDAHHPGIRAIGMSAAIDEIGDPALGRWLTEDVPAALVEGRPVPSRPEGNGKGGFLGRLFGRG